VSGIVCPTTFRVDDGKLRRYLLDPDHGDGGTKCAFLLRLGFAIDDPLTLMAALVRHPSPRRLTRAYPVPYGLRCHFEGALICPDGSTANVRTVWQADTGGDSTLARFITLVPLRKTPASV
jgi:hypothetical protein